MWNWESALYLAVFLTSVANALTPPLVNISKGALGPLCQGMSNPTSNISPVTMT